MCTNIYHDGTDKRSSIDGQLTSVSQVKSICPQGSILFGIHNGWLDPYVHAAHGTMVHISVVHTTVAHVTVIHARMIHNVQLRSLLSS